MLRVIYLGKEWDAQITKEGLDKLLVQRPQEFVHLFHGNEEILAHASEIWTDRNLTERNRSFSGR